MLVAAGGVAAFVALRGAARTAPEADGDAEFGADPAQVEFALVG